MANDLKTSAATAESGVPPAASHWTHWFFYPSEGSTRALPVWVRALNFSAALLLVALAVLVPFTALNTNWNWSLVYKYREKFYQGYALTIEISLAALVLSTVFGSTSALAGRSRFLPLRYVNRIYVDLVRGTPLLVQILILYYVTANFLRIDNRNVCGVLILSFSYGAYISEVIRAGIESVGKSQLESAKAIGLTTAQTYRYVIFPQALRQTMPPLAGQLVSLIKDSSLLSIISVGEFAKNAEDTSNITYSSLECFIVLAVGYLILTLPISFLTRHLEKSNRSKRNAMKLHVENVSKTFGTHRVLDGITMNFEAVQTLALIGPSGGGKSTFLRVLAGLEYPDDPACRVVIDDVPVVYREKELARHRRTVGTVFQAFNLFPHLTALQNVTLPLEKVHGMSREEAHATAMQTLTRFRLGAHTHKKPAELSGGQRQRVAIARAIAIKPRLLFFDEPTSALDPEMTSGVLEVIEELRNEGRDFVLVTHEMGFARRVADQVALLADGRIVESGPSARVFDAPEHEMSRNFFAKVLRH